MNFTHRSLKDLLAEQDLDIRKVFTHNDLIFTIKNQDPVLKTIFTPESLSILLSYLNQQHELEIDNKELCYKMPQAALQILSCQSHLLTELIFESQIDHNDEDTKSQTIIQQSGRQIQQNNKKRLLTFLLNFLNYQEHYFLAGYFSKVMASITKRVFSPTHKYNQVMCNKIFLPGNLNQESFLTKAINHIYSQSVNDLVVRWLTLKGKDNYYYHQKGEFLFKIVSLINLEEEEISKRKELNFSERSLESITNLIMQLLKSELQPPPERPQPIEHKNINLVSNKNSQKQLYRLICQQKHLAEIMKPVPNPNIHKILLIKRIVQQYRVENEQISKLAEEYRQMHLSDVITEEMLIQSLSWLNQILVKTASYIDYSEGTQSFINKKMLIAQLQLLYQFHLLTEVLRQPLTFYYQQKQNQHVDVLVKFLRLKNNLIQNILTKIILIVLNKLNCIDFATALLHFGISQVIDQEGIRQHVLEWAKVILKTKSQQGHIYENAEEEARWDHMRLVVNAAEDIVIGKYRFRPSNLSVFFSIEKAKDHFKQFLEQPIKIDYEQRFSAKKIESEKCNQQYLIPQRSELKKKLSSPPIIVSRKVNIDEAKAQDVSPILQKNPIEEVEKRGQEIEEKELDWLIAGRLTNGDQNRQTKEGRAEEEMKQLGEVEDIQVFQLELIKKYLDYNVNDLLKQME